MNPVQSDTAVCHMRTPTTYAMNGMLHLLMAGPRHQHQVESHQKPQPSPASPAYALSKATT